MRRDIENQIKQGKQLIAKHRQADISLSEIEYFCAAFKEHSEQHGPYDALLEVIGAAFHMGVAVGARNYK